jgi:aminoglycoside N3'-acetyltransferase
MGSNQERSMKQLTKEDLIRDLKKLVISAGDLLNVKALLRSFCEIKGGVETLIDALLVTVGSIGAKMTEYFVTVHSPFRRAFRRRMADITIRIPIRGLSLIQG